MSIVIQKKDLFEVIQKAYPIIPLKSSLQILSNFRISYNAPFLEVASTDLDHFLRIMAPAKGEGPFDVTVNARKMFEIVRELPDGEITLNIDENVLLIETERGFSCKIAGADTLDFPGFPEVETNNEFDIPHSMIRDMIQKSSFAVAKDESRACLCGIYWEVTPERTGMIATDGHRLGSSFMNGTFSVEDNVKCIISPKSVVNMVKTADTKTNELIRIAVGEKYIMFSTATVTMCSKLIDGPYPDYTQAIPRNNPKQVIMERTLLQEAVRRVSVLSNQKTHLVKFTFNPETLEIVVLNRDIGGEARETVSVSYDGEEHIIGFNGQYFNEILDIIKEPKIRMEMNTQISACLIFPVFEDEGDKTSEDLYLIMPLRIVDEVE